MACYKYRGYLVYPFTKQDKTEEGWICDLNNDFNVYKSLNDAKQAIDNRLGGWSGRNPSERYLENKPVRIIGEVWER
jgi:hypothetical protein